MSVSKRDNARHTTELSGHSKRNSELKKAHFLVRKKTGSAASSRLNCRFQRVSVSGLKTRLPAVNSNSCKNPSTDAVEIAFFLG
jgi:hypothetical protein